MKRFFSALAIAAALATSLSESKAGYVFVGSRVALAGTDFIDWSQLGPAFTAVPNPSGVISNLGVNATVSDAVGNTMERRDQGNGWAGDFLPGQALLWTQGDNGPMTISFSTLVDRAGAQYQSDAFGAFTAMVSALDAGGNVLASFVFAGNSTSNADGSTVFAGIQGTGGDTFAKLVFTGLTASFVPNDFAINQLDFSSAGQNPVPAPASIIVGAVALAGFGLRRWTKKS